jgi:hypothetical protein
MFNSSLQSTLNGKADTSSLGTLASKSAVEYAQLGSTIIQGGYIKSELLNVTSIVAQNAKIGAFIINSYDGLTWNGYDYFGGTAYKLMLGTNKIYSVSSNVGSILCAWSNTAEATCCISAVVNAFGIAIYGSTDGYGSNFPTWTAKFAGFFSGNTKTTGTNQSYINASQIYRIATSANNDGSYSYYEGISFDPKTYDLDKIRLRVRAGLIIGVTDDDGKLLQGT